MSVFVCTRVCACECVCVHVSKAHSKPINDTLTEIEALTVNLNVFSAKSNVTFQLTHINTYTILNVTVM